MSDNNWKDARAVATSTAMGLIIGSNLADGLPNYTQTVDQVALSATAKALHEFDPKSMSLDKYLAKVQEIHEANKEEELAKRAAIAKPIEDEQMVYTAIGGVGGAGTSLLATGLLGWKSREEKKKAEKAAQGNEGKNV